MLAGRFCAKYILELKTKSAKYLYIAFFAIFGPFMFAATCIYQLLISTLLFFLVMTLFFVLGLIAIYACLIGRREEFIRTCSEFRSKIDES